MNSSNEFFLKQMKGVSPIKKNNRVEKERPTTIKQLVKKNTQAQVKSLETKKIIVVDKKSKFNLEKINIKKNIRKKLYKIDKKIDFHGTGLLESEELFFNTIEECYNRGLRCLLFITGKGLYKAKNNHEKTPPKLYHGVIRSSFTRWVTSISCSKKILSYEKASIEHGGDGAFYVYLRKKKN